jgi:alkylmercury lyase
MRAGFPEALSQTIDHISLRWHEADKSILRQIFPLLAEGRRVHLSRIVQATGRDSDSVLAALTSGHTEPDSQGCVSELFGITREPTYHRIQTEKVVLFSCCALVAHMIPLLLEQTSTIESVDPVRNSLMRLVVSPGGVESVKPRRTVGTLVVTRSEEVLTDVRSAFCSHVRHFPDRQTAGEFAAEDSRRYVVELEELCRAARELFAAIWSRAPG